MNLPHQNSKTFFTSNVQNFSQLQMDIVCYFDFCQCRRNTFSTPRAGNPGNVLLTTRNPPKFFYQCTHCQENNVRSALYRLRGSFHIKIFLRNCFTPLWCPEKPKERHRMKKSIRKTTKNRCCLLKKEQEISFGNVGLVFFFLLIHH